MRRRGGDGWNVCKRQPGGKQACAPGTNGIYRTIPRARNYSMLSFCNDSNVEARESR